MRRVTLTFDNGPSETTPQVLDCLLYHNIRATFFVLGSKLEEPANMSFARRAHDEGHWVGNHTFTHTVPLGELDAATALSEFERTNDMLSCVHQTEKLFRPYGRGGHLECNLLHPTVVAKLVEYRYSCVLWNCVPEDWIHPHAWADSAIAQSLACEWALIVLHDLPTGAMDHLDEFIVRLRKNDFELRQDFPDDCVPIRKGHIVSALDRYLPNRFQDRS